MAQRSERRGIVTPEAVLLEFDTASVPSRAVAAFIDFAAIFGALVLAVFVINLLVSLAGLGDTAALVLLVIAASVVVFGYGPAFETLWDGRTLGKASLGLRVVTAEGGPVRFRHAAIRGALAIVDFWILPIGIVATTSVLLSKDDQRLGDLAAGTLVLRARSAHAAPVATWFVAPRGWEDYAASLHVRGLDAELYGSVRRFLTRVHELSAEARPHLAAKLADRVAAVTGQPVPPYRAEPFLACIAVAYQRTHRPAPVAGGVQGSPPAAHAGWSAVPAATSTPSPVAAPDGVSPADAPATGGGFEPLT